MRLSFIIVIIIMGLWPIDGSCPQEKTKSKSPPQKSVQMSDTALTTKPGKNVGQVEKTDKKPSEPSWMKPHSRSMQLKIVGDVFGGVPLHLTFELSRRIFINKEFPVAIPDPPPAAPIYRVQYEVSDDLGVLLNDCVDLNNYDGDAHFLEVCPGVCLLPGKITIKAVLYYLRQEWGINGKFSSYYDSCIAPKFEQSVGAISPGQISSTNADCHRSHWFSQTIGGPNPETIVDSDGDGISDAEESELLARFRPYYLFSRDLVDGKSTEEHYNPTDVGWYLRQCNVKELKLDPLPKYPVIVENAGLSSSARAALFPKADITQNPTKNAMYLNPLENVNGSNGFPGRHGQSWQEILVKRNVGLYGHVVRANRWYERSQPQICDPTYTYYKIEYWQFFGYNNANQTLSYGIMKVIGPRFSCCMIPGATKS
jgi:hypothetical protein